MYPWQVINFFGHGHGPMNEPRRGYFLTFGIGFLCCMVAKLDLIAPVISMLFMATYALTNYACFAAHRSKSPSWRPSFKYYDPWLSLLGVLICLFLMFLMDWLNSLIALILGACLYVYLESTDSDISWGAAGESRKYLRALSAMMSLQSLRSDHVKTFRPQFLVLAGSPARRQGLVKFVSMLRRGYGIMVNGHVLLPQEAARRYQELAAKRTDEAPAGGAQVQAQGAAAVGVPRTAMEALMLEWKRRTESDTTAPVMEEDEAKVGSGAAGGAAAANAAGATPMRLPPSSPLASVSPGARHRRMHSSGAQQPSLMDSIALAEQARAEDLEVGCRPPALPARSSLT